MRPMAAAGAAESMGAASHDDRPCGRCGQECRLVLDGMRDDRFGAPGVYAILKCTHCGLEQTWPRPTAAALKDLYERFYNAGVTPESAYRRLRERFFASGLYRLWLAWDGDMSFHGRRGAGRLLDVGCNEGRSLSLYAQNGFEVEGLELNETAAAAARRRGFPVHTTPLAQFRPQAPYDVVVLANVLEHAWDPAAMLAQVRGLLRPGGEVWISCPNAASLWRRVFGRAWINWHVPFHLWHFSPQTLQELLASTNFSIIDQKTFTPALWVTQSICLQLSRQQAGPNKLIRCAPLVALLTVSLKLLVMPFYRKSNRHLAGDCLLMIAQSNK
jgi:2-polyprenyl-3-methyl-5-hydroxy-6-metoxy-1,4-benzoquinol methylase